MRDRDWRLKEGTKQTEGRMQTGHWGGGGRHGIFPPIIFEISSNPLRKL